MIDALEARNLDRTNRIYAMFVDTTSSNICGIGTIWNDDRADGHENFNNFGPSYARADASFGCWDASVLAHEVMHNLGGVQLSAPNTSNGFHCIDEWDVMCYSDTPDHPEMRIDCPDEALDNTRFDCGGDDYYNVDPDPGSYLATHWNPAENRFLIGAKPYPDGQNPTVGLTVPGSVRVGRTLTAQAAAEDNIGVEFVTFGVCPGGSCSWDAANSLGSDFSPPYTRTWKARQKGSYTFLARATDFANNVTVSSPKSVKVKKKRR
jgi:hypothetical protein